MPNRPNNWLIPLQFARWAAVDSIGLCLEAFIFGMAAMMIWALQMPRENKAKAMLAFAVRLP